MHRRQLSPHSVRTGSQPPLCPGKWSLSYSSRFQKAKKQELLFGHLPCDVDPKQSLNTFLRLRGFPCFPRLKQELRAWRGFSYGRESASPPAQESAPEGAGASWGVLSSPGGWQTGPRSGTSSAEDGVQGSGSAAPAGALVLGSGHCASRWKCSDTASSSHFLLPPCSIFLVCVLLPQVTFQVNYLNRSP